MGFFSDVYEFCTKYPRPLGVSLLFAGVTFSAFYFPSHCISRKEIDEDKPVRQLEGIVVDERYVPPSADIAASQYYFSFRTEEGKLLSVRVIDGRESEATKESVDVLIQRGSHVKVRAHDYSFERYRVYADEVKVEQSK